MSSMKGQLVPFCSARPDSLAVGESSVSSFLSACMTGCDTGRGAGVQSSECSICMGDGGTSHNTFRSVSKELSSTIVTQDVCQRTNCF